MDKCLDCVWKMSCKEICIKNMIIAKKLEEQKKIAEEWRTSTLRIWARKFYGF